jgi:Ser/Thr protein kinase RdoA (MazF antagonist)
METNQIQEYFSENYPNLGTIKKISEINHNNINSNNFLILTTKKKYVLRIFSDQSPPIKTEKICEILNYCKKKGIKVSSPILNKNKKYVDPLKRIYLTNYEEGGKFNGNRDQLKDLAKNLALLHKCLSTNKINYNYRTNQKFYKILDLNEFKIIIKKIDKKKNLDSVDKKIMKNFEILKKSIEENSTAFQNVKNKFKQKQLIHHDLHPDNVIFNNNKLQAIIDFNSMRKGFVIQDISFAFFRFINISKLKDIRKEKIIFIQTYIKYNKIEIDEELVDEFFKYEILKRLSFIIRKKYFHNSVRWIKDFEKNIVYLKNIQN